MANSSLILSSLDFDTLKSNFKEFLKAQSVFKDYDFDGSNINVLLDVMSYNSYLNAFYLNMVASEMFLDTNLKYDSAVSHAKELNYIPRSRRSSVAEINVIFDTNITSGKLVLPKNLKFTGVNSNGTYSFTTNENRTLLSSNSTFTINNLQIFEGNYFTDSFVVDYNLENQKFIVSNENVDTNSITVDVIENNGASNTVFTRAENLFNIDKNSNIFFLQAAQNNKFEIVFGDGLFGRRPINMSVVKITYKVTSGSEANFTKEFVFNDDLDLLNQATVSVQSVQTVVESNSGSELETIESIQYAAPRYFATQQRAVSSDDYASLVISKFGGEVSDVVIYGGQDLEPKLYGRVVVCLKSATGTVTPNYVKNKVTNYLLPYIAIPNRIVISDPEYLYASINSKVQYDNVIGEKSNSEITSLIYQELTNYSTNNLEKFGKDLRYSRVVSVIDETDSSIVSNDTEIRIIKRIFPLLRSTVSYEIETNNKISVQQNAITTGMSYESRYEYSSLISSKFTYVHNGVSIPLSYFVDDNNGIIKVYNTDINTGENREVATVGSINYETGKIILKDIYIANYEENISIYLKPFNKDILANKNKIILIDTKDINVNVLEVLR
jgi:hypothetical protein